MSKKWIVAAYDCNMASGGSEEGGWWYDSGELVKVLRTFPSKKKANDYAYRLNTSLRAKIIGPNVGKHSYSSVLSEGEIRAYVMENNAPKYFPETTPHYE